MPFPLDVRYRMPLLLAGFVSLAVGIGGGLLRLGWNFPLPSAGLAGLHGPLLVCGFLGTVISLERAVAIERRWAYAAPLCAGLGGLWLVAGGAWAVGAGLFALASAILAAASLQVWLRLRALFTLTMLLGALGWLLGNLLWLGGMDIPRVVPWWLAFLVLTIAGERLELSRFLPRQPGSHATFGAIVAALLLGAALATLAPAVGVLLLAPTLFLLACWLLRHDIARRTFRQPGLTGYMGVCLLSGYVWLLVAALVGAFSPQLLPGASYDAFLHAILVGFVLSMIFAHAPVIFPAVTRIRIPYHAVFYVPLIVLHASLLARLAGDLLAIPHCRAAGGALNAAALLLFVLCAAGSVLHGKRQAAAPIKTSPNP